MVPVVDERYALSARLLPDPAHILIEARPDTRRDLVDHSLRTACVFSDRVVSPISPKVLSCNHAEFVAIVYAQLLIDVGEVGADGAWRYEKGISDLAIS